MSNDGTGLRDAELDARTIYDIACIRADASNATREDVEFKAIALRNYKAIEALSAVAPPPVLLAAVNRILDYADADYVPNVVFAQLQQARDALSTTPAAPAQPEGGEAVAKLQAFKDYVHQRLDDMGVPADPESPHKAAGCRVGGRLDYVEARITRPAPAQQAVTDEGVKRAAMHLWGYTHDTRANKHLRDAITVAFANTAAASAADAQEGA